MKRKTSLILMYFAIFCVAILGGCSCSSKNDTPTIVTTPISLTINNKDSIGDYVVDGENFVYVGSTIKIDYQIRPGTSTQNDVNVFFTGIADAAEIVETTQNGVMGSVLIHAVNRGEVTVHIETKSLPVRSDTFTFQVVDPTILPTPTHLVYEDGYVIWDKIDDAKNYTLVMTDNAETLDPITVYYDPTYQNIVRYQVVDFTIGHEYTVKVKANGNGTTTADGSYSQELYFTALETVTDIRQEDGVIYFDPVARANAYQVEITYLDHGQPTTTIVTIPSNGEEEIAYALLEEFPSYDEYSIRVKAIHPSTDTKYVYLESEWSHSLTIYPLSQVANFTIHNGQDQSIIRWDTVEYATYYTVKITTTDGLEVKQEDVYVNEYKIPEELNAGEYHLQVMAHGEDNTIDGTISEVLSFTKIGSINPSSVKLTGNLLTFESVIGVEEYQIYYENEIDSYSSIVTGNSSQVGLIIKNAGLYHIAIRVIAKENTGLNLVNSNKLLIDGIEIEKLNNATITCVTNQGTKTTVPESDNLEIITDWANPTVEWETVQNATSYTIYLQKGSEQATRVATTTDTNYTFGFVMDPAIYHVWVQANGENAVISSTVDFQDTTTYGFTFEVLPNTDFEDIEFHDDTQTISFSSVAKSTGYIIKESQNTQYYYIGNQTQYAPRHAVAGQNTITIYAWGNNYNTVMSKGTEYSFAMLYTPEGVKTVNGELVIVENEQNGILEEATYELAIYQDQALATVITTENITVDIRSYLTMQTPYEVAVRVKQNGKFSSAYSPAMEITLLGMNAVSMTKKDNVVSLSWDTVTGATAYQVTISQNHEVKYTQQVSTNTYTIQVAESGAYLATVYAIGNSVTSGIGYLTSVQTQAKEFYKLNTPQLAMAQGKLTWSTGDLTSYGITATGYQVKLNTGKLETVSGLSYYADLDAGKYTATVTAIGDDVNIISSEDSIALEFDKLAVGSLTLQNGVLQIVDSQIEGVSYNIYHVVTSDTGVMYETIQAGIKDSSTNIGSMLVAGKTYQLIVEVTHDDYMTSNKNTTAFEVEKLPSPTQFRIQNNQFLWETVEHATGYAIDASNTMEYHQDLDALTLSTALPVLPNAGEFDFSLTAIGDSVRYVSSAPTATSTYQLSGVSNVRVEDGILVYDYVDRQQPVRFELELVQGETRTTLDNKLQKSFAFKDTDQQKYVGNYQVTITVIGDGSSTISSTQKETIAVTKLSTATNLIVGKKASVVSGVIQGVLQWNAPSNATPTTKYILYLNGAPILLEEAKDAETVQRVGYEFYEEDGVLYYSGNQFVAEQQNHIAIACYDDETGNIITSETTVDAVIQGMQAPQNLAVVLNDQTNTATLTWNAVNGATSYMIYEVVSQEGNEDPTLTLIAQTEENQYYMVNTDIEGTTHQYVVLAVGSDQVSLTDGAIGYWTSAISSPISYTTLGQITGLQVSNGILTWDLGNATKFMIKMYDYEEGIDTSYTQKDALKVIDNMYETTYELEELGQGGKYFIALYPLGDGKTVLSNDIPATITVTKLSPLQNVRVINGILTWDLPFATINSMMQYQNMEGEIQPFDYQAGVELANLVKKYHGGQMTPQETTYFNSLAQLVYFELGAANLGMNGSSVGTFAYQKLVVSTIVSDDENQKLILSYDDMIYNSQTSIMRASGYYQIKLRSLGNTGDTEAQYDLFVNANYPSSLMTVYRSIAPQSIATGEGDTYISSYIHNETIIFKKVPFIQQGGEEVTTLDTTYVVEYGSYDMNMAITYQEYIVPQKNLSGQYGEVNVRELLNATSPINQGKDFYIRVRVLGTEDSTAVDPDETIILRSGVGTSSKTQILTEAIPFVKDGELMWGTGAVSNALQYEVHVYKITSKDDVIGQQEADIVRIYDSKIITYEDLDVDFAEHQFGAGWYAFKVRALGDGTAFLNGEWSPEVKVYRLPEILQGGNTIDLDYGDFVWTPNWVDAAVTSPTAAKAMVYQSAEQNGGYTTDKEYSIVSSQLGEQSRLAIGDQYLQYVDGLLQYYKIAIANMVEDDEQPTEDNFAYLRSSYTTMDTGYSRLSAPTGLRIENGKITWDGTGNQFEVMVNGTILEEKVFGKTFSLDANYKAGSYEIKLRNLADSITQQLSSVFSNSITVTKLNAPDLRLEQGKIVWNTSSVGFEEVGEIAVEILQGSLAIFRQSYTGTTTNLDLNTITLGNGEYLQPNVVYTITVQFKSVLGNTTYVDGEIARMNFTILQHVTLSTDDADTSAGNFIKWNSIDHALGYKVYVYVPNTDGVYEYDSVYIVYVDQVDQQKDFEYDPEQNVWKFSIANIQQSVYRIYVEAMGSTISADQNTQDHLYASSLLIDEDSYMDIELPQTPVVDVQSLQQNGKIVWTNKTTTAYPVLEYSYMRNGETISSGPIVLAKSATTYYLPTIAQQYTVKIYAMNDLGVMSLPFDFTANYSIYASGSGSQEDPYIISTAEQFLAIRERNTISYESVDGTVALHYYFQLSDNITLSNSYTKMATLDGVILGNGKSLTIPNTYTESLFGTITKDGSVTNLVITKNNNISKSAYRLIADMNEGTIDGLSLTISGTYTVNNLAFVAGTNTGTISNISVVANALTVMPASTSNELHVFMITEWNKGTIVNITLSGSLTTYTGTSGEIIVAGVAYTNDKTIKHVVNTMNMTNNTNESQSISYASKLAGIVYENKQLVEQCGVEGVLSGSNIAGIIYQNYAQLNTSYFTGSIRAVQVTKDSNNSVSPIYVGGLVVNNLNRYLGADMDPRISNSYVLINSGNLVLDSNVSSLTENFAYVGGLVTYNNSAVAVSSASIVNCYVVIHDITSTNNRYQFGQIAYSSNAKQNGYSIFNNVYYYSNCQNQTLIKTYESSEITMSNNTLSLTGVTVYTDLSQMTGLTLEFVASSDHVKLKWQA